MERGDSLLEERRDPADEELLRQVEGMVASLCPQELPPERGGPRGQGRNAGPAGGRAASPVTVSGAMGKRAVMPLDQPQRRPCRLRAYDRGNLEMMSLASPGPARYNQIVGTWDEEAGKTVGRRVSAATPIADAAALLTTLSRLMPRAVCPKGVWRFNSFEEADQWALNQAARSPAPRG